MVATAIANKLDQMVDKARDLEKEIRDLKVEIYPDRLYPGGAGGGEKGIPIILLLVLVGGRMQQDNGLVSLGFRGPGNFSKNATTGKD